MSIDRIGKGPSIAPPTTSEVAGPRPTGSGEVFQVARAAKTEATNLVEQVRSGELSVEQYLDQRVSEATSHLEGKLAPDQLEFVRNSLREQLATDPVLVDLVRGATGAIPPPPRE